MVLVTDLVPYSLVLMTDLVPTKNEYGEERYPIEAVESMFDTLFPDEFRGIIPVYDHRPVDRLLDQRDDLLNDLNKARNTLNPRHKTTQNLSPKPKTLNPEL